MHCARANDKLLSLSKIMVMMMMMMMMMIIEMLLFLSAQNDVFSSGFLPFQGTEQDGKCLHKVYTAVCLKPSDQLSEGIVSGLFLHSCALLGWLAP